MIFLGYILRILRVKDDSGLSFYYFNYYRYRCCYHSFLIYLHSTSGLKGFTLSCCGVVYFFQLISSCVVHMLRCHVTLQVPSPSDADLSPPVSNSLGQRTPPPQPRCPAPSNLFTLNDPHDCSAARHWLCANFVELEGERACTHSHSHTHTRRVKLICSVSLLRQSAFKWLAIISR